MRAGRRWKRGVGLRPSLQRVPVSIYLGIIVLLTAASSAAMPGAAGPDTAAVLEASDSAYCWPLRRASSA